MRRAERGAAAALGDELSVRLGIPELSGWRRCAENAFVAPFYAKNDPFAKTGSGKHRETLKREAFSAGEPNDLTTNFVGHCSQNPYDFGNTVRASLVGGQAPAITELMSSAWASLAKTGIPTPQWAAYSNATDASFSFGDSVAESGMRANKRAQCDFLRWCRGDKTGHAPVARRGQPPQLCTPTTPTPP